jgi:uncharacterized iron-regulated protein
MFKMRALRSHCLRVEKKNLWRRAGVMAGALGLACFLGACASNDSAALADAAPTNAPERGWQTSLRADEALVGKIWEVSTGRFISAEALLENLKSREYVLLGEKHDNPDHHLLQREILAALSEETVLGAVSFEMMTTDIAPRLKTLGTRRFASSDLLAEYIEWDTQGWDWEFYGPLLSLAYERNVPIYAGNISRTEMSSLYASDSPVAEGAVGELARAQLRADIDASHCGLLPESQFDAMVRVQQGRDESLARSLTGEQLSNGKVALLIAGNYHIRQDLGVPNYWLRAQPTLQRDAIAAVAFLEVAEEETQPGNYLEGSVEVPSYDYLWFTPALANKDYCAGMRGEE